MRTGSDDGEDDVGGLQQPQTAVHQPRKALPRTDQPLYSQTSFLQVGIPIYRTISFVQTPPMHVETPTFSSRNLFAFIKMR